MILGIGTDLCNIDRVAGVLDRHGDRFRTRVFTETELSRAARRPHHPPPRPARPPPRPPLPILPLEKKGTFFLFFFFF